MKIKLCIAAALLLASSAWAAPLTTYTHNYGNGVGQFNPGGDDKLSPGYVTIEDTRRSDFSRFNDAFDFSALSYSSIDHFDLTITYARTNGGFFNSEAWYVRPGGTPDQYWSFGLDWVGNTPTAKTFTIDSTLSSEFDQMIEKENFFFWLAEETWFDDSFRLFSATLSIYGEQAVVVPEMPSVPEPGSLALLGVGLAGLGLRRRAAKKA